MKIPKRKKNMRIAFFAKPKPTYYRLRVDSYEVALAKPKAHVMLPICVS